MKDYLASKNTHQTILSIPLGCESSLAQTALDAVRRFGNGLNGPHIQRRKCRPDVDRSFPISPQYQELPLPLHCISHTPWSTHQTFPTNLHLRYATTASPLTLARMNHPPTEHIWPFYSSFDKPGQGFSRLCVDGAPGGQDCKRRFCRVIFYDCSFLCTVVEKWKASLLKFQ